MTRPPTLTITHRCPNQRSVVVLLGGVEHRLPPDRWLLLVRLHWARVGGDGGWLRLGREDNVRKALSRLRLDLARMHPDGRTWIGSGRDGRYRLTGDAPSTRVEADQLAQLAMARRMIGQRG